MFNVFKAVAVTAALFGVYLSLLCGGPVMISVGAAFLHMLN